MLRDSFHETCLNVSADHLELEYIRPVPESYVVVKRIPYTIDGDVYTILSAINDLVKLKLLNFDPDSVDTGNEIVPKKNLYALHNLGKH